MQRRKKAEIDVHRLKMFGLRIARNVSKQGPHRAGPGRGFPSVSGQFLCSHDPGQQANSTAFHIAFAPGDLTREADMLGSLQAQLAIEQDG